LVDGVAGPQTIVNVGQPSRLEFDNVEIFSQSTTVSIGERGFYKVEEVLKIALESDGNQYWILERLIVVPKVYS
jgi:hypothetical protein